MLKTCTDYFYVYCRRVFTIDLRALAVMRIMSGISVVLYAIIHAPERDIFLGSAGISPTLLYPSAVNWTMHLWGNGFGFWITSLFLLQIILGALLCLGYRTKLTTPALWILITSLHHANPWVLNSGDDLMRLTLFFGMFLPWGARYSLSSVPIHDSAYRSPWTVALMLQIVFLYIFAIIAKHSTPWFSGAAVYYALSEEHLATTFGTALTHYPEILTLLTYGIFYFQHTIPFFLLSPFYTTRIRIGIVPTLAVMHIVFFICLHIGFFSWNIIALLFIFLPAFVWDRFDAYLYRSIKQPGEKPRIPQFSIVHYAGATAVVSLIVLVNISQTSTQFNPLRSIVTPAASMFGLNQTWRIFASPYTYDGWFVMPGKTATGYIDILRGGAPLSFERPNHIASLFPSEAWRKYLMRLEKSSTPQEFRISFTKTMCARWNRVPKPQHVESLSLIYMRITTPPPGAVPTPPRPNLLSDVVCMP
ncbi:hypothetical protein EBR66_06670 [bacterium]|nr:hypothetical protein [bacterium]